MFKAVNLESVNNFSLIWAWDIFKALEGLPPAWS